MRYGNKTTFKRSRVIQGRVIYALLMREIITRYGRNNIGFLWLFVEPLMMTLLITLFWKFIRANQVSTLNIVAFAITGYPLMMMWRNASGRAIGAVSANLSLLYHRNVRPLDTIFARMLLEIAGATTAQIFIMLVFIAIDWMSVPQDALYMVMAWLLMAIFAVGLGLIICAIAQKYDAFGKIWGTLSFVFMPLSGAFFLLHTFPQQVRDTLQWVPMISGTEMFRHGYFGDSVTTYENVGFLVVCDLAMLLVGLIMVKNFSEGIEPQ